MRMGLMIGSGTDQDGSVDGLIGLAKRAEQAGFDNIWMANIFGLDAITTLAMMGRETSRLELGTAVVPSYPRHPAALAQQSLTAAAASGGRFTLGLGLSHQLVIENMFGLSYDKPARHMKEYLQALVPMLNGEAAAHNGDLYRVNCQFDIPGFKPVPLIVAALGDVMLKLAGTMADGTTTWMTGPVTLESHIIPSIRKAAKDAGRPEPRIVCGLPIALTNDVEQARDKISKGLEMYGMLPSYRAMLDKEGAAGPADVSILGDEASLREKIQQLRDIGVTDFNAAIMSVEEGGFERTLQFLEGEL
jgi:5,10-methylenetetrahydromethanopterin reductase